MSGQFPNLDHSSCTPRISLKYLPASSFSEAHLNSIAPVGGLSAGFDIESLNLIPTGPNSLMIIGGAYNETATEAAAHG